MSRLPQHENKIPGLDALLYGFDAPFHHYSSALLVVVQAPELVFGCRWCSKCCRRLPKVCSFS